MLLGHAVHRVPLLQFAPALQFARVLQFVPVPQFAPVPQFVSVLQFVLVLQFALVPQFVLADRLQFDPVHLHVFRLVHPSDHAWEAITEVAASA